MERIIGKYTLNVTSEEINKDKSELSLWLAQTFRYSNDEKGIEDALKGYIRNLKDRIERIEKALEQ